MNSERDRINQWEYAMEQAKTEGRTEGKAEEKISIAKNLKLKNIPLETIAQCTGLTLEEIGQLQDQSPYNELKKGGALVGSKNILFIHTGGMFGLFPVSEQFEW